MGLGVRPNVQLGLTGEEWKTNGGSKADLGIRPANKGRMKRKKSRKPGLTHSMKVMSVVEGSILVER